jgi:hypothetical protein
MNSFARLIRNTRPSELHRHLRQLVANPEPWDDSTPKSVIVTTVQDLPSKARDQFLADAERICAMTDEIGQAAILALPEWRERISAIEAAHARAHWLFLESKEAFHQAEETRYADEHRNAGRLWDGFVGPADCQVQADPEDMQRFETKLLKVLSLDRLQIEQFERLRSSDLDRRVVHLTIYSEDVPEDELVFAGPGVIQHRARKPVRETTITYEPQSGTIEVVGRQRATRQQVACAFAETLLGIHIDGDRLPPRRFDLSRLLDPHSFPTRPDQGIAKVKLTRLGLSSSDRRLMQILQVPFNDPSTLHEIVEEQYGEESPLDGGLYAWSARLEVQLEPEANRKRGKKINVDITAPNKCSLRGKTAKERLLLQEHLKAWGLEHDEDE